jgi:hypothetical protein
LNQAMKQSMIGVAAALLLALVPTSVYAQGTD